MSVAVTPLDQARLLAPLLPALPAAAAATRPALKLLPLLSPILRQRVQLLSASSSEPWLRLLCYDAEKAVKLAEIAHDPSLEPHPVSGEVEVDWGYDTETRYRRLDSETLQALVALPELGIAFQLIYCADDLEGGGDGWRVGEVTVVGNPSPFLHFGGAFTIPEAEQQFQQSLKGGRGGNGAETPFTSQNRGQGCRSTRGLDEATADDAEYWGSYDATLGRTPTITPCPASRANSLTQLLSPDQSDSTEDSAEDDYFVRYDNFRQVTDSHGPHEEETQKFHVAPPLGLARNMSSQHGSGEEQEPVLSAHPRDTRPMPDMAHPRPESSASSNGSHTIARLEETAGKQAQGEFCVKKHVSRSIRSLYLLARASGIAREEFDRLVQTELAVLSMIEDQE